MENGKCKKVKAAHVFVLIFFMLIPAAMYADEEGVKASTDLELQVSTAIEAKLKVSQSFVFPFLQGSSPLTEGNNIAAVFGVEATPISLNGFGEINFTPAAFFVLSGGGMAGSGWNIPIASGIGINRPIDSGDGLPRETEIDGSAFDGLIWSGWGAGTLQFDLGAVFPGDWNHVLFQTRQELRYSAYSRAGSGDPWIFENDDAENLNGWIYLSRYVLGYSMPLSPVLDTVAFMAEMKKPLYRTTGGDFWGESLGYWIFSTLFNFSINPRFSTALALQMHTRRNHGTSYFNNNDYYYQDFELKNGEGQRRILFYRAAMILNYKIR